MSIEPYELKELIAGSKAVYESCGGAKSILPEEAPVIEFAYASVVAIDEINPGDKFSRDNIWVKRPGTGELLADRLDDVLGRTSLSKIAKDDQIRVSDIRDFK
jgi:N-acetylneuraminate synthase